MLFFSDIGGSDGDCWWFSTTYICEWLLVTARATEMVRSKETDEFTSSNRQLEFRRKVANAMVLTF